MHNTSASRTVTLDHRVCRAAVSIKPCRFIATTDNLFHHSNSFGGCRRSEFTIN